MSIRGCTEPVSAARRMVVIDRVAAMILLSSVSHGRIVFNERALPAIRVVNHLIDDGDIIVRTGVSPTFADTDSDRTGTVVVYEADTLDPLQRLGWNVVVTGIARPVVDPERTAGYMRLLHPWVDGSQDTLVVIQPQIVTGFRLIAP